MSSAALGLVLTAAVLHAGWNFAAKQVTVPGTQFVWLYGALSAAIWCPVALVWVVVTDEHPHWVWVGASAASAAFHIVYQLVLQRGYERSAMNVVYPVARGVGPLLTAVVAVVVLGEVLDLGAWLGIVAVVLGVVVIATGRGASGAGNGAGIAWGAATGVSIAAYTLWDDRSVTGLAVPPLPYFALTLALQVPALTLLLGGEGRRGLGEAWRVGRRPVVAVALLSPLAYLLVLRAMQLAPVALVAPVRETSIVIGALLSWLVLREERPARRLLGSAVVLAGIAAIALG